jgi:hypothetical protein
MYEAARFERYALQQEAGAAILCPNRCSNSTNCNLISKLAARPKRSNV